jgi:hypothetical protein
MGLNADAAAAIGQVAVAWTVLETSLLMLLNELVGTDTKLVVMMGAEAPFLQRLSIISSMVHYSRNREWFDEWQELQKRINILRNKRNDIIHGHWGKADDGGLMTIRIKAKGKLTPELTVRPLENVQQVTADILGILADFQSFMNKVSSGKIKEVLLNLQGPPLSHTQSPKAQAQDQARAKKKATRQNTRVSKLSSAQKRALREAN